jgi:hypothetical protein
MTYSKRLSAPLCAGTETISANDRAETWSFAEGFEYLALQIDANGGHEALVEDVVRETHQQTGLADTCKGKPPSITTAHANSFFRLVP